VTKRAIDAQVAALLGIHQSRVSLVTTTFIRLAVKHIARYGILYIDGLGEFARNGINVHFKKSPRLHLTLRETIMEKYGVNEQVDQETLEKAAAQGCPNCGAKPERHGQILSCPNCGTEPFEKKSK
jgi:predicted RNA-binding Zn-ribbon protein involved in translation (DUF1610 family)